MIVIIAIIGVLVLLLGRRVLGAKRRLPLPPGPPGEPLIGHLRVIPTEHPEIQYAQWAKEYNTDILHFRVLGRSIIVLNSIEAAHDLLDKRGANYADRPRFVLFEVMGWGVTLTFLRWSRRFRLHRKILQTAFTQSACKVYQPIQTEEACRAARAIIEDPNSWEILLRQFSTAVVLRVGFGIEVEEKDDPYIKMTLDVEEATGKGGVPAGNIVDFFPILRYLPNGLARSSELFRPLIHARSTKKYILRLHDAPWEAVEPSIRAWGQAKVSFMRTHFGQYLANEGTGTPNEGTGTPNEGTGTPNEGTGTPNEGTGTPNEGTVEDLKGLAGAIAIAGGNTTWFTIIVCILGLLENPQALTKARGEMEDLIGIDENGDLLRRPSFEDRPQLKYLANVLHESTRWQPLSPLGVPHATLADDGYHIPAGSVIYPNVRAMSRDERYYSSPEEFWPEKYQPLAEGGRGEPLPDGPFGFGRRKCPGEHLAMSGVYIMVATLLATMHVQCPTDENGNEIRPNIAFSDGLSGVPDHFGCRITPRSVRSMELLRD